MKLFDPLPIRGMVLPNRIMVPAMVTHLCKEDGVVTEDTIARYERYAQGGAGLIVVEAMAVHQVKSGPLLRIAEDRFLPGLRRLTARVHQTSDSKIVPQIIHFLKVARSGWRQTVDMLSIEEIDRIVEAFGDAVARAREAGFDGAELHSAHAYTLSSFLSRANPRTDDYGRTLEGRLRLAGRVMENVRRKAGADFPVGIRFNGEEFIRDGYTVEESKRIALRLAHLGFDYLSISAGGKFEDALHQPGQVLYPYSGYSGHRCMPGEEFPPGLHVPIAERISAFLYANGAAVPVAITGKLSDPAAAEAVIALGKADIVGIARGLLADPDWPAKVRRGELERIVQCDYCNVCKALDGSHQTVICALWPQGTIQAPARGSAEAAPRWPAGDEPVLAASVKDGRVSLRWKKADGAGGYDVYRAERGERPRLADAVKVAHWIDETALAGTPYRYFVRARSATGACGPASNECPVRMPAPGLANGRSDEGRDSLAAGIVPWPEVFARRYREAGFWEGITLCEMLQRSAARLPGKTAVVDGERRLSYAELLQRVERQAAAFLACGLSPGERVVFQLGNGLDLVVCLLGLARIGVVPVMALPAHRDTEIAHFLRQSKASAYLVPDVVRGFDYREMARRVAPGAPGLRTVLVQGDARAGEVSVRDLAARAPEPALALEGIGPQSGEVALMLLSGGTTGLPKLIPRTHDDYVYTCKASGRIAGFGPDTVFLAVLPMAHNYTLGCPGLLGALAVGGTVVIAPSHDAETVFGLVEAERVTSIGATVPLVARWLASDAERRRDLSSLRVFMNGGAKLPPELRRRVEERLRCRYQENFGTGEGLLSITRLEDSEAIRFESSGRPVSEGDEIRVIDDAGQDVPDGQTGELAVRGPYTVRGYFDAPQINAEAFTPDGFYRMGDIVRRVDGYLYLEGRRKDIINRGGQKVSCEEVENFILAHPRVQSVCVVAMPDPTYGEKACAFVIPREGSTLEFHELTAFLLAQGIAKFKMPERLEIVSDFPISPAGKVLRRELRALIAEKLARESSTA